MDDDMKWYAIMMIFVVGVPMTALCFSGPSVAQINAQMKMEAVSHGYGTFNQDKNFIWKSKNEICECN